MNSVARAEDGSITAIRDRKTIGIQQSVDDLVALCHGLAVDAGWWHDPKTGEWKERDKGNMIALMHSELSEALEGVRKDKQDDHLPEFKSEVVEFADAIIRIADYCGRYNLPLGAAMLAKLAYNANRPDHKPEARAAAGGKAF